MRAIVLISAFTLGLSTLILSSQTPTIPSQSSPKVVAHVTESEGVSDLKIIYRYVQQYRALNNGRYPQSMGDIVSLVTKQAKDLPEEITLLTVLSNTEIDTLRHDPSKPKRLSIPYIVSNSRPDGSPVGSVKLQNTHDVLASTNIYVQKRFNKSLVGQNTSGSDGHYLYLTENGDVESVPLDQILYVVDGERSFDAYYDQAGVPVDRTLSYEEFWAENLAIDPLSDRKPLMNGKKVPVPDNGGPESLVTLSRLLNFPSRYGIEREELWKNFDPAQDEFNLSDVQQGSAKLKLPLEARKLSLEEVAKFNTPAIFETSDDKRLVVLANLDDREAIIVDRGLTRIVSRELLAKRYGGEVLVSQAAAQATAGAKGACDNPVRVVALQNTTDEITQQVTITNSGDAPLSLQIERPIPGCTQADLSTDTVAPGQQATLSLKLKWRDVLKGSTQNVLVFLKTNDARRPRMQLGFKLQAPEQAATTARP